MSKTEQTLKLEQQIYHSTKKQGIFGCFEVTIGWFGKERVDYMTYDTKGIFRCYEIKVSKSDFNSKAKVSFVGHYNYYVLTPELYDNEQIRGSIPDHIGIYIGSDFYSCNSMRRAKKQELLVDEQVLKDSMIRSLTRYLDEKVKSEDKTYIEITNRQIRELEHSVSDYRQRYQDLQRNLYSKFGPRWKRTIEEMEDEYK